MIKIGTREFESKEAARDFFRHWFKKSRLHRFDLAEQFRKEMEEEGKKCSSVMVNGRVYEFSDKEKVTTQSFDIGTRFQGRAIKFSPPLKTFAQKSYFVGHV